MSAPIVFLDTETCGLALSDPIWDIGLIRREPDGTETEHQFFVEHDAEKAAGLPDEFRRDHDERYDSDTAYSKLVLVSILTYLLRPVDGQKVHVVGAVPNFDTERIAHQFGITPWHHHLIDVENLAVGFLAARRRIHLQPPWNSDAISRYVGVNPDRFARHTALGDAQWARAIYDEVLGSQA